MALWLKAEIRLRTHPKTVLAGPAASWVWLCGCFYCREHLTDGFIPDGMMASLVPGVIERECRKYAAALVKVGLWEIVRDGFQVHDFLDWNPSRVVAMAERAQEAERKRVKRHVRSSVREDKSRNPDGQIAESGRASSLLSSSSALGNSLEEGVGETFQQHRPLISGESSPAGWAKVHGNHTTGFCDWLCLPDFLFSEFTKKCGVEPDPGGFVKRWALSVRANFEGQRIGDDNLVFWRARWTESFGTTKAGPDKLGGLREFVNG